MSACLSVGGRKLALVFNVAAMDEIEERLGVQIDLANMQETIVQKLVDRRTLVAVIAAMARQGQALSGDNDLIDEEWLKARLKPGAQMKLHALAVQAMSEGLLMESGEDGGDDVAVDVVLEELKKKRETGGSV